MKQYKSKDFLRKPPHDDTLMWVSTDKQFTITTTTNQYSQYFVYCTLSSGDMEWVGIQADHLEEAIEELNKIIESEEILKYL